MAPRVYILSICQRSKKYTHKNQQCYQGSNIFCDEISPFCKERKKKKKKLSQNSSKKKKKKTHKKLSPKKITGFTTLAISQNCKKILWLNSESKRAKVAQLSHSFSLSLSLSLSL
jgi:hypothetical protein